MELRRGSSGERIILSTSNLVGEGGEARIFGLRASGLAAKIYHKPTPEHAVKLAAMLANPPADPMSAQGYVSIAWPRDLVQVNDESRRVLGYLMALVTDHHAAIGFYNPKVRREKRPLTNYVYLLRIARNLAAVVRAVHECGYVIGDINESNLLVSEKALVTLVDTDSFQVPDPITGKIYRCRVGRPEFTPPELQGRIFSEVDRSVEHDRFGLAVLVFQLLMEGTHPFAGRFTGAGEPPSYEERIAAGHFPYGTGKGTPYDPMPLAPPLEILPPVLRQMLLRCFEEGHRDPTLRPEARDWFNALGEAEQTLTTCLFNEQHRFSPHLRACPWCDRSRRLAGSDPFPSRKAVQAGEHLPRRASAPTVTPSPKAAPRPVPARVRPTLLPRLAWGSVPVVLLSLAGFFWWHRDVRPVPNPFAAGAVAEPIAGFVPLPAKVLPAARFLAQGHPWTNTLGMTFAPVKGLAVWFSIWETRVQDYQRFAQDRPIFWTQPNFTQGPTHPAVFVSWDDAQAFCTWLTQHERAVGILGRGWLYRLPTDPEWSLAVGLASDPGATTQAKDQNINDVYPWGTQWPPPPGAGNYDPSLGVDTFDRTSPVGSFAANRYGLCDLGGNVWEWCQDSFDSLHKKGRVLRGGSWYDSDRKGLSSAHRVGRLPSQGSDLYGFRLVLEGGTIVSE